MLTEPVEVIDLGVYLDQAAYPPWGYRARHVSHAEGAKAMSKFLNLRDQFHEDGSKVAEADFPEALGLSWTSVQMSDHTGNHIDAPFHFGPTVEGKPAKTIDQVPLTWCMGPGVRLDFRGHSRKDIGVEDLKRELDRVQVQLVPGMIPLLWTGADARIDEADAYWQNQAGLSPEGLHYLLDHGIRLVGIDAYAMDVSYDTMQKPSAEAGTSQFFPLHFVGRAREHMHLEKLSNLGALPRPSGFLFCAFPVKLRGGSAGWVRPVALVPRSHMEQGSAG